MALFCKRPLAFFCFILTAATICGCFLHAPLCLLLAAILLGAGILSLVLYFLVPKRGHGIPLLIAICLACAGIGIGNMGLRVCPSRDRATSLPENVSETLVFTVLSNEYATSYSSGYTVLVTGDNSLLAGEKLKLSCNFESEWEVGDILCGEILLSSADSAEVKQYAYAHGIYFLGEMTEPPQKIGYSPSNRFFDNLRESLSATLTSRVKGESGRLISAILLGTKDNLSGFTIRDFRRSGMSHLLAISGMHLSLIILMIDFFLKKLAIHKNVRCVIILAFAAFYLVLTGFSLSTVRAFFMCVFVYLSFLFQSDNDHVTALFLALGVILLVSPTSVFDVGLWLSFSATLGIILANQLLEDLWRHREDNRKKTPYPVRRLVSAICLSLAANFTIIPVARLYFDEISLVSVFSNLVLSPLTTLLMFLSPWILVLGKVPLLGPFLVGMTNFLSSAILKLVHWISEIPGICVSLHYPFLDILFPVALIVFTLLLLFPLRHKWIVPTAYCLTAIAFFSLLINYNTVNKPLINIDYLDVNSSEMIVLCDTSEAVIIDVSKGNYAPLSEAYKIAATHERTEISSLVLTHYHSAYAGSIYRLCKSVPVRALYLPFPESEEEYYHFSALLTMASEQGIAVTVYDRNTELGLGDDLHLTVGKERRLTRSTHPVTCLSISARNKKIAYATSSFGETGAWAEEESVLSGADYLILGQHGPVYKEQYALPDAVMPANGLFIPGGKYLFETLPAVTVVQDSTSVSLCLVP